MTRAQRILEVVSRALKNPDPRIRALGVSSLRRIRGHREEIIALLKDHLPGETDLNVQIAIVCQLIRRDGVDFDVLDLLGEKWNIDDFTIKEQKEYEERDELFLDLQEKTRLNVALSLWGMEPTRRAIEQRRRESAQRENPDHPRLEDLKVGMKILYRERAILPIFDEEQFERNRDFLEKTLQEIRSGERKPYLVSPRGFILVEENDLEWMDTNNLRRRVHFGIIRLIRRGRVFVGDPKISHGFHPAEVLEILPDDFPEQEAPACLASVSMAPTELPDLLPAPVPDTS